MSIQWIMDNMGNALAQEDRIKMENCLTEAIETMGKAAVTDTIRQVRGHCKRIVQLHNGRYNFHLYSRFISIDWAEPCFITYGNEAALGLTRVGRTVSDASVWVTYNPAYGRFTLCDLIDYGQECEECGAIFLTDSTYTTCEDCRRAYEPLPYSARAEEMLETEPTNEILFGVELEYEGVSARDVKSTIPKHAIAKRDGSIHNGVEVVTRPASLSTHKKELREFYSRVKTQSAPNTGMHVHIQRSKVSEYQIGFMMEFLNDKNLVPHIEHIAGRKYSENTYCRPREGVKMTEGVFFDEGAGKIIRNNTDKYSPLNTAKKNTVEIRIFSSPESHLECSAKLDFVNALVQYSSPYSVSVKRLKDKFDWDVFLSYVQANAKHFPHFAAFYL